MVATEPRGRYPPYTVIYSESPRFGMFKTEKISPFKSEVYTEFFEEPTGLYRDVFNRHPSG